MGKSAFDPEGTHEHEMCPGCTEHGHAMVSKMTKHAKGGHQRGFFGKKKKGGGEAQGGGEGMTHNEKGNKGTGKKKEGQQSHGFY